MRFVDPDNEFLRETAHAIQTHQPKDNGNDNFGDERVSEIYPDLLAGYKLKLEEALIFDAVQMFAEAINASRPLIKPREIDCYNKDEKLYSGTSIVNIMKGVSRFFVFLLFVILKIQDLSESLNRNIITFW